ncbi:hypothetical protein B484DRAFT_457101 [Ochromonadaceae sp. CCMP2298]|nr:hypothetical protein B484DRAFT_457101 [Ochromonadaceae sp. CCMP2298]|mmetsp:Transcript_29914/g.66164  ORF Transcript_29914/g.66164 Transcript_29914/m.66164 type:complete len:467 (-) Transcript_29914:961-2361(-)
MDSGGDSSLLGSMMSSLGENRPPSVALIGAASSGNADFNSPIIARLRAVETEAKETRVRLATQIAANEGLREENRKLKAMVQTPSGLMKEVAEVRRENEDLQARLGDMEAFLGDYGLVWRGSQGEQAEEAEVEVEDEVEEEHSVAFSTFKKHVDELNAVVYAEPAQVVTEGEGQRKARLVSASELLQQICIVWYRNGITIQQGFRKCGSAAYKSFVGDIVDGYFPSEFQDAYPDGVVFDLKDRHAVRSLEGEGALDSTHRHTLLNRLPKTIIHKGQLVDAHGAVAQALGVGGSGGGNKLADPQAPAPTGKVLLDTPAAASHERHESMGQLVQIQVRWVDRTTVIAKMYEHNTVGDLKVYLQRHFNIARGGIDSADASGQADAEGAAPAPSDGDVIDTSIVQSGDKGNQGNQGGQSQATSATSTDNATPNQFEFELRSAHPPRLLGSFLTLTEAGLAPNGTVHVRKL